MNKVIYENTKVPIKLWLDDIEEGALQQAKNAANLPFVYKHIAIMPDAHQGYGVSIGTVLATEGVVIPNAIGVDIGCFTGDTKIPLLNGTQKTLKELTDIGEEIYIYSLDEKLNIVPGKAIPKLTKKKQELLEIIISGGEIIKCTPDHQFMLRDGSYKEAKDLKLRDSLMPLYKYYDKDGYERIRTSKGHRKPTHQIIAEFKLGKKALNEVVHHKDGNWFNNEPSNLEYKDKNLHSKHHRINNPIFGTESFKEKRLKKLKEIGFFDPKFLPEKRKIAIKNITAYNNSEEAFINSRNNGERGKKYLIKYNISKKGRKKSKEIANRFYKCEICNKEVKSPIGLYMHKKKFHSNHSVFSIKKLNYRKDVYCLTVEKYHNFALSSGVFVHNCGLIACKTSLKIEQLDKETLKLIMGKIREVIPVGFNHHKKEQEFQLMPDLGSLDTKNIVWGEFKNAMKQLGTLGGGNHFIELQKDKDNNIWIMIHSGSRNLGYKVAKYYNDLAVKLNEKWFSNVPKKYELAFLPIDTEEAKNYMLEMQYCVDFALANRKLMMDKIKEQIWKTITNNTEEYVEFLDRELSYIDMFANKEINIAHNYAQYENHYGKNVIIHRKGATLARLGTIGIIPGSMGSKSYIVEGLGNPESFMSCSHGAGRALGRKEAIRILNLEIEKEKLDSQGIIHGIRNQDDLEEATSAYKSIEKVMANQSDLVKILAELIPIAVIKG